MIDPNDNSIYYCSDSSNCYKYEAAGGDGGDICVLAGSQRQLPSAICCLSVLDALISFCANTSAAMVASVRALLFAS